METPRLVLITGINGFIGAHTAAAFLKAGYAVRGTARQAKSPNIESLVRALSPFHGGDRLEVVEVPNISVDGAFDQAVHGSFWFLFSFLPFAIMHSQAVTNIQLLSLLWESG